MKTRSILLLCTVFLLTPLMFIPSIHAVEREVTVSGIAEQDAMTSTGTPSTPIGSFQDNLEAGYNIAGNYLESYLYFNFTNKPTNYLKAELSLYFWGKAYPGPELNLTVCLIEESWDEQTITWNNAPSKGQVLGYYIYNNDAAGVYKLDISSVVDGITNISVCVYMEMDNFVENSAPIYSSEDYLMQEQAPQIIWTYIENATFTVIKPDSLSEWSDSETFSITWLSQGQIEKVRIELFEGSTPITNISSYETNDAIYNWTIPSYLNLSGTNYLIKISDYDDPAVYGFSEPFSINIETIYIPISHPDDVSYYTGTKGHTITWTITTNLELNTIYYVYQDETLFDTGGWQSGSPVTIIVDGLSEGIYEFRIEAHSGSTIEDDIVIVTVISEDPIIPGFDVFIVSFTVIIGIGFISWQAKRKLKKL